MIPNDALNWGMLLPNYPQEFSICCIKGGFGHFIHIFSKCFLKSFIALFYTLMHVVAIFQVSEHFNAPS